MTHRDDFEDVSTKPQLSNPENSQASEKSPASEAQNMPQTYESQTVRSCEVHAGFLLLSDWEVTSNTQGRR